MRNVFYVFALILLSACNKPQPSEYHHTILTFGTLLDITLADISPELAEATFEQLEKDYQDYHASWTPWQESDLTKINSAIKLSKKIIPSPNVSEDHQTKNAMAITKNKGAIMIKEDSLDLFQKTLIDLFKDTEKQNHLRMNIKKMALPNATNEIVNEIQKLIK